MVLRRGCACRHGPPGLVYNWLAVAHPALVILESRSCTAIQGSTGNTGGGYPRLAELAMRSARGGGERMFDGELCSRYRPACSGARRDATMILSRSGLKVKCEKLCEFVDTKWSGNRCNTLKKVGPGGAHTPSFARLFLEFSSKVRAYVSSSVVGNSSRACRIRPGMQRRRYAS
jgi:hypothetical protein